MQGRGTARYGRGQLWTNDDAFAVQECRADALGSERIS
jgi:hypothetical protein